MTQRFENKQIYWLIINTGLFAYLGIENALSKGMHSWIPYAWWIASLFWLYQLWSYKKYGYITVTDTEININSANWNGIRTIQISEIRKIENKNRLYIITIKGLKNFYINKRFISKKLLPDSMHRI